MVWFPNILLIQGSQKCLAAFGPNVKDLGWEFDFKDSIM